MTAFWIAGAVTAGLFGRLGDMFGKRKMIVATLLVFSLGGVLCALASTLGVMIAGRFLMGCGVGLFPLAYSLIRDEFEPRRAVRSIAFLGGIAAIGGAVGQSTGGFVSEHFGVSSIFWLSVVDGPRRRSPRSSPPSPSHRSALAAASTWWERLLLTAALAAPLMAIAEAPAWGWADSRTLLLFAVGALLLTAFARLELRREEPLIDMTTLVLPRIRMTNVATWFVGFGFFGFSTILTQFFQEPRAPGTGSAPRPTEAGLFLVPGLVLLTITSVFAGRLSARVGPTLTLRLGVAVGTIGIAGAHAEPRATRRGDPLDGDPLRRRRRRVRRDADDHPAGRAAVAERPVRGDQHHHPDGRLGDRRPARRDDRDGVDRRRGRAHRPRLHDGVRARDPGRLSPRSSPRSRSRARRRPHDEAARVQTQPGLGLRSARAPRRRTPRSSRRRRGRASAPRSSAASIAASSRRASSGRPSPCSSSSAAERSIPVGFAMPCPGDVGRRAVRRARRGPRAASPRLAERGEAEPAGHFGGDVREDVAERVLGQDHVELLRARGRAASPRCRRACARARRRGTRAASAVTTRRHSRDVSITFALSTEIDAAAPRARELERAPRDPLDLRRGGTRTCRRRCRPSRVPFAPK